MRFGYCAYWSNEASFWQMGALYGTIRFPIWGYHEMEKRIVDHLHREGCTVLLHPTQYTSDQQSRSLEDFRELVAVIADEWRAHPAVIGVELLNEPNHSAPAWHLAPATAAHWAREGHKVLKAAGWAKPILVNGPARVQGWENYLGGDETDPGRRDLLELSSLSATARHRNDKRSVAEQIEKWRRDHRPAQALDHRDRDRGRGAAGLRRG